MFGQPIVGGVSSHAQQDAQKAFHPAGHMWDPSGRSARGRPRKAAIHAMKIELPNQGAGPANSRGQTKTIVIRAHGQ